MGESAYFKHGKAPHSEFRLGLQAVLAACADAGINPTEIDGFASFSKENIEPQRIAAALGLPRLRSSVLQWGGGGGGTAGAVANAAAAIAAGLADCMVVVRSLAQGQTKRFGQGNSQSTVSGDAAFEVPYGISSPAQRYAMKAMRFMLEHGVGREALRAIAMASYHHAQANPRAVMHGRPLDEKTYDESRWIVEPFRLFDCCMENDGAAALVLVSAERARDFKAPVYIMGAASGTPYRTAAPVHNDPNYGSAGFSSVADDLYRMAGIGPADVGVVQSYENFTGGVLMSLAEHGLFKPSEANAVLQLENLLAPDGRLPLNTSGGNLAECYVHGLELVIEAVRQVRGTSTSQAKSHDIGLVIAGPMVAPVSNLLVCSEAAL